MERKTQLAILSRELALILQAGLTIQDALDLLMKSHSAFKDALAQVALSISQGARLSEALNDQASVFGKVYGKTVAIGEETGSMVAVFSMLADWQEREAKIHQKTYQALIYPIFVFAVASLGALLFSFCCFPLFTEVLSELGGSLPGISKVLIRVMGVLLHPSAWFVGLLAVGLWIGYLQNWLKNEQGRLDFELLLLSLPILGPLVRDVHLARLLISLTLTTRVGLDLVTAFLVSVEATGSPVLKKDAKSLATAIAEGMMVHQYLETRPDLYPKDVVGLICVGEESGTLERCFEHLAIYYEREVDYRISAFLAMLEPLCTGLVSVFVGAVILALILPIGSVLQQL